jgi:hypothetical protein
VLSPDILLLLHSWCAAGAIAVLAKGYQAKGLAVVAISTADVCAYCCCCCCCC